MNRRLTICLGMALAIPASPLLAADDSMNTNALTSATASAWAKLPLRCIAQEYPNKLDHVMNDAGEVRSPRELHPAFYGCFDWHSAVHGHWMLVRLLRTFPEMPIAAQIRAALDCSLSAENIRAEVDYLDKPNRKSFERTTAGLGCLSSLKNCENGRIRMGSDGRATWSRWRKRSSSATWTLCRDKLAPSEPEFIPIRPSVWLSPWTMLAQPT